MIPMAMGDWMSGRPAGIRARDCKQIIIAAKRAGATQVMFQIGDVTITVPTGNPTADPSAVEETEEQITL